MVVQAQIARTGVQIYRNPDGSRRREYRPPAEVGHADSLASLKLIPFTIYHPPVMVTSENATQYSRGTTGETITFDGKWVSATIAVQSKDAVEALQSMQQISVGYDCDLEMTAGVTPEGEHYDCIQRNIRGNHVALVPDARAGAEAAIRMDAAIADDTLTHKDSNMDTAQLTAKLTEALENVAKLSARVDSQATEITDLKNKVGTLTTDNAKLAAERDEHKDRADKADKARTDAVAANPAKVKARVALEGQARKILGKRCDSVDGKTPEVNLDALLDRDVQLAVIKHVTNVDCMASLAGKDDAYITAYVSARYDAAIERATVSADTHRAATQVIENNRTDAQTSTGNKRSDARAEMIAANRASGIPAAK